MRTIVGTLGPKGGVGMWKDSQGAEAGENE